MKDSLLLLLTALGCSFIAWAFWHFLGNDAWTVLLNLMLISLAVDNVRLRRKLNQDRSG